jgi:predicted DNA binding CopG/RHH family protein
MAKKKEIEKPELPDFSKMSEDEIAEFWETHDVSDYWDRMEEVKEKFIVRPKKAISMRLDEKTITQLKVISRRKGIGYQTLIRMWIKERLEQELQKKSA